MSREISIEEQLAPYVEKLHAEMRAVFGVPGMSLGSPEAARKLKEVKKDVEVGPLPSCWTANGYTIINGHGEPVAVATPNENVDLERFQRALVAAITSGGKTLLSKPHPKECICPKCPKEMAVPGTRVLNVPRIGDAERDQCLERLRYGFGGGYLSPSEHDARQDAVMSATMRDELDFLVKDLPAMPKPAVAPEVRRDRAVTSFLCRVVSVVFPVMTAVTILLGTGLVGGAILAILGGVAALLLTFLQLRP